jgi:hypothetical protein
VGYGDISPTTPVSKIFTMIYIFLGMSLFASFAGMLVKERGEMHKKRLEQAKAKKDE